MGFSDCPDCWSTPCDCSRGHLGSKNFAYETLIKEHEEIKLKCEEYRKFVASWAWHGFNGSPYTEEQAIRLSNIIQNACWDLHIKLENKKP